MGENELLADFKQELAKRTPYSASAGGKRMNKWVSTGRSIVTRDGSKRILYSNAAMPAGEQRIKRFVVRKGIRKAQFIAIDS